MKYIKRYKKEYISHLPKGEQKEEMMDTKQTSATNGVFLSVIVPVYNAEKTLHACVRSILAQTHKDYELLLIDDGSQDASADICKYYASEYKQVRYLHKENGGPLSARVFGAQNAVGGVYRLY